MTQRFETVDEYVASFPAEVRARLEAMRATVRAAAPTATEGIAYGMPTYRVGGRSVVHLAAWSAFISVYPTPAVDDALEAELEPYRSTRSTLRFPLDRDLPHDLLARVVTLLVEQRAG